MNACPASTLRAPVVSWSVAIAPGRSATITILDGCWHWRLDEPNAKNSRPFASYPAALAALRHSLGLPAIAQACIS